MKHSKLIVRGGYAGLLIGLLALNASCNDDPIEPLDNTNNQVDTTWVDDSTNWDPNGGGNTNPNDSTNWGGNTNPNDSTNWDPNGGGNTNPNDSTNWGGNTNPNDSLGGGN